MVQALVNIVMGSASERPLALSEPELAARLQAYKDESAAKVECDAEALQARLREG